MKQRTRSALGLYTVAGVVIVFALLLSALRFSLPYINHWRSPIVAHLQKVSHLPLQIGQLSARWKHGGPQLILDDISLVTPTLHADVGQMRLQVNVWQSLWQRRWQFNELTFSNADINLNATLDGRTFEQSQPTDTAQLQRIGDLVFEQLTRFDLRNSQLAFLSPNGEHIRLDVEQLRWLNRKTRHQAEGVIVLQGNNHTYGQLDLRLDLQDGERRLANGQIYLQGKQLNIQPWLTENIENVTGLRSAQVSASIWLDIANNDIQQGVVQLNDGQSHWSDAAEQHTLGFSLLQMNIRREGGILQAQIPDLALTSDGIRWPLSSLSFSLSPTQFTLQSGALDLARITPFLSFMSMLSKPTAQLLQHLSPRGQINQVQLSLPRANPALVSGNIQFSHLAWQQWEAWPGISAVSGHWQGSLARSQLQLHTANAQFSYPKQFPEPITLRNSRLTLDLQSDEQGWSVWSSQTDLRTPYLQFNGQFRLNWPNKQPPWLSILAGINLNQAAQAWRYYPHALMGKGLTSYLTPTLKAGQVTGASLLWAGNPLQFPYKQNNGVFQVKVPVRHATFAFDPHWLPLTDLNIDLLFENDRLLMNSPHARLGAATATKIAASIIPLRADAILNIAANVQGNAPDVQHYLTQSPLRHSVGSALSEIEIHGLVKGALALAIPLNGAAADAKGQIELPDNQLRLKALNLPLDSVKGYFRFDNGTLTSGPLTATLWQQPMTLSFMTQQQNNRYHIGVDLAGNWAASALMRPYPSPIWSKLGGHLPWKGHVNITLPAQGGADYHVKLQGSTAQVRSALPAPFGPAAWRAANWQAEAKGNLQQLVVKAQLGALAAFQGEWQLDKRVELRKASLILGKSTSKVNPSARTTLVVNVPEIDADGWLRLLNVNPLSSVNNHRSLSPQIQPFLPEYLKVNVATLKLAEQKWTDLLVNGQSSGKTYQLNAYGQQIRGHAIISAKSPWLLNLSYFYFDPEPIDPELRSSSQMSSQYPANQPNQQNVNNAINNAASDINFNQWPAMQLRCSNCWLNQHYFKQIQADITPSAEQVLLSNGLIDSGFGKITLKGRWARSAIGNESTELQAHLRTDNFSTMLAALGIAIPLRDTATDIKADLRAAGAPWQLLSPSLSGTVALNMRKGMIADIGGRTGQVLRLISTDSLLRKLKLDFSDAFQEGFFYDKITGNAVINQGILKTDNLLIDGLLADIALKGSVNLMQRTLNMEALIAPELGAGLSVATAFVVNPVAGLALFTASQVLSPLWSKISLLRYHLGGSVDNPVIKETQRIEKGSF
ncbi:MAG: YhdP family protein [Plesiomonas sp.]|uniref:YhdP family protein n=1 Tax=Plesiomonas sp. TaxID=2486279 RepID=UPI003F34E417